MPPKLGRTGGEKSLVDSRACVREGRLRESIAQRSRRSQRGNWGWAVKLFGGHRSFCETTLSGKIVAPREMISTLLKNADTPIRRYADTLTADTSPPKGP